MSLLWCGILEVAANDRRRDLTWSWPKFGLSAPDAGPDAHWTPVGDAAGSQLSRLTVEARISVKGENHADDDDGLQSQIRAAVKQTRQVEWQGQKGKSARAKGGLDKLRPGRELRNAGPARVRDRGRRLSLNQRVWPTFVCIGVLYLQRETQFTKFVGEEIATAHSRHSSRRCRIPMPASPRHRTRCNRHEARAGIVALVSCCLARLSNGGLGFLMRLSHYQRARGEVFAVLPLWRAAWIRWLPVVISEAAAMHCFSHVPNGTSMSDPEPVNIFMRCSELGLRTNPFHRACCKCTVTRLSSRHVGRTTCAILRTPTRKVTTPNSLL